MRLYLPLCMQETLLLDTPGEVFDIPGGVGYPRRGVGYPQIGVGYPRRGVGYPRRGVGYPRRGVGYPRRGVGYPRRGVGYPRRGVGGVRRRQEMQKSQIAFLTRHYAAFVIIFWRVTVPGASVCCCTVYFILPSVWSMYSVH